jgi:carboxypeptidase C (cathepsin A)
MHRLYGARTAAVGESGQCATVGGSLSGGPDLSLIFRFERQRLRPKIRASWARIPERHHWEFSMSLVSSSLNAFKRLNRATCAGLIVAALAGFAFSASVYADEQAGEQPAAKSEKEADQDGDAAKADETASPHGHAASVEAKHDKDSKAEGAKKAEKTDEKKDGDKKSDDEPKPKVTKHKVTIAGQEIAYTATAGKMVLRSDEGDPKANVFFVAYKKVGEDAHKRPITFCFNGGPGSSSVWLHIGMLGPKRVKLDSDAKPLRPPHELIANPYSLLDVTDLVFIDPVSTGYSRPAKGEDKKQFHGYDEDLQWVAQFIHDFTSKFGRWGSPKFLIGESYGGLRAAGLSSLLMERYRMYLNGIVLVSAVVDFQTISTFEHNDIAYALFLPTYAATAWYHKALGAELQGLSVEQVVKRAEKFAAGPYLRALAAGDSLPPERREEIVKKMAELTGLSPEYVSAADLRVSMPQFGKELLRDKRRVVGRFDSRYLGIDRNLVGEMTEHDPSASAVFGTFTSALNDYLRSELKVDESGVYEILTNRVFPWSYGDFTNRYVDASESLASTMTENPFLKVFAACGYYDLATPEFAMKYTAEHLKLPPELRGNFTLGFYEGGHMMYAHEPSLVKLREDLLKFYKDALSDQAPDLETR